MKKKKCPKFVETSNPSLGECKLRKGWLCVKTYAETYYQKCSFLTASSFKEKEK